MMKRLKSGELAHDKEYASAVTESLANPSHIMSFVLILTFWASWTPYIGVRLWEHFTSSRINIPFLHFGLVWLGVLNSFWKALILLTLSPDFRLLVRFFCLTMCCRPKGRLQAELMGVDMDD